MKILYLIDSHPQNGGAPISTCSIAGQISNNKKENIVYLLHPKQSKKYLLDSNISVVEIDSDGTVIPSLIFNPIMAIRTAKILYGKIKDLNPDIIHAQMPRSAWIIGLLKLFKLIPNNIRLIYTDRDHTSSYKWPFRLISLFLIKSRYDEIVCLTNISASYWRNKSGKANVRVIPNFAGIQYENYNSEMRDIMRNKHKIMDDMFVVMFSGRMSIYKNWGLAKSIMKNLSNEKIFFILAISTMNEEQEKEFDEFCKDLKRMNISHLLFHNVTQDEMANYYYLSDVFVLTSDKESFGRTAIEAMSRKCIVIGRNVGGLPEVIGDEDDILDCDETSFSERILYYKINNKERINKKEWYFERFMNRYTIETNIDSHKILYEDLLGGECDEKNRHSNSI